MIEAEVLEPAWIVAGRHGIQHYLRQSWGWRVQELGTYFGDASAAIQADECRRESESLNIAG